MSEINFGELNGYNTVMEYSMKLLEIIKSLDSKEPDFESMKKLADPQYEYASAKLICMIQSINFFLPSGDGLPPNNQMHVDTVNLIQKNHQYLFV